MKIHLISIASALLCAGAASAQTVAPTPLERESARADAAEAANRYLVLTIRGMYAAQEETAKWWAEVWKALPPEKK